MRRGITIGGFALLTIAAAAFAGDAPTVDPQRQVLEALRRGDDPSALLAELRQQNKGAKSLAAAPADGLDEGLVRLASALNDPRSDIDQRLSLIDSVIGQLAIADARFGLDEARAKKATISSSGSQRMNAARKEFDALLGGLSRILSDYAATLRAGKEDASQRSALAQQLVRSTTTHPRAVLGANGLAESRPSFPPVALPTVSSSSASFSDSAAAPPVPADTATSTDAPVSAAVLAKARSLGYEYHRIHDFVRSSIRTEWYSGAQKGPDETLRSGAGNDVDQASLLIALLRASSAPARYAKLVVELPVERLAPMLGVHAAADVGRALTAAGIANQGVFRGGVVVAYRFEHTVVSAYLPYGNYRGTSVDDGARAWIPLDPSIKPYALRDATGVLPHAGVSASAFTTEWTATPQSGLPLDLLRQRAASWLATQPNHPTLDSQTQLAVPDAPPLGLLPNSLPGTLVGLVYESATLPEAEKQSLHLTLRNAANAVVLDRRIPMTEVIGKRLTLSYLPATKEDQDTAARMGGIAITPIYLLKFRARLSLAGEPDRSATAEEAPGDIDRLEVGIESPAGTLTTSQQVTVGAYVAIVPGAQASALAAPPESQVEPLDSEFLAGRLLVNAGLRYNAAWDRDENDLAALVGVTPIRPLPAISLVLLENQIESSLGVPQRLDFKGVSLDASLRPIEPIAADRTREAEFLRLNGLVGSAREHWIFENDWSVPSVSAEKGLALAASQSIPRLAQTGGTLPASVDLPTNVLATINAQLAHGWRVDLATRELSLQAWRGAVWHAEDTATGESGWYIAGRYAGGSTVQPTEQWLLNYLVIAFHTPISPPPNEEPSSARHVDVVSTLLGQYGTVGKELDKPLAVLVTDSEYRPVHRAKVRFTVTYGRAGLAATGGTFGPDNAPVTTVDVDTDEFGVARVRARPANKIEVGPYVYLNPADHNEIPQHAAIDIVSTVVLGGIPERELARQVEPFYFYALPDAPASLKSMTPPLSDFRLPGVVALDWWVVVLDQYENRIANQFVQYQSTQGTETRCPSDPPGSSPTLFYTPTQCPRVPSPQTSDGCASPTATLRSSVLSNPIGVIASQTSGVDVTMTATLGSLPPVSYSYITDCLGTAFLVAFQPNLAVSDGGVPAARPNQALPYRSSLTTYYLSPDHTRYERTNLQDFTIEAVGPQGGIFGPTANEGGPGGYTTSYTGASDVEDGRIRFSIKDPINPIHLHRQLPGYQTIDFGITQIEPDGIELNALSYPTEPLHFHIFWKTPDPTFDTRPYPINVTIWFDRDGKPWTYWGATDLPAFQERRGTADIVIPPAIPFESGHTYTARVVMNNELSVRVSSASVPLKFGRQIILGVDQQHASTYRPGPQGVAGINKRSFNISSRLDVPNNRLCSLDDLLIYTLGEDAHLTIKAYFVDENGVESTIPRTLLDIPALRGTGVLTLEPFMLDPGNYHMKIVAEAADGQRQEYLASLSNHFTRDDTVPLAHAFVKGVDLRDGHLTIARDDIAVGGRGPGLHLTRYYSSLGPRSGEFGILGYGWTTNLDSRVMETQCGEFLVIGADGGAQRFVLGEVDHKQVYVPLAGYHGTLARDDIGYHYYSKDGTHYLFAVENDYRLTRIEDPDGNAVVYTYSINLGQRVVSEMRDSAGRAIVLNYESQIVGGGLGLVLKSAIGPGAQEIDYVVDARGVLVSATNAATEGAENPGNCAPTRCELYHYDDLGSVTLTNTDDNNQPHDTPFLFGLGLTKIIQQADGSTTTFGYEVSKFNVAVNKRTGQVSISYADVRVASLTEADGGAWGFAYTSILVPQGTSSTTVTDGRGRSTTYSLNKYGAAESVVDPAGTTTTTWDFVHYQPKSVKDAHGTTTTYTYDDAGNRTSETIAGDGGSISRTWTYARANEFRVPIKNRVKTAKNARGIIDSYGYDTRGHVQSHTHGNVSETFTYASNGDPHGHIDYNGHGWSSTFDDFGYIASRTDPLGHVSGEIHDARGRLISETDANGNTTTHGYDASNRRVSTQLPPIPTGGNRLRFIYDDALRTLTEIDANGHPTTSTFDRMGRVVSIRNAKNDSKTMTWDHNGNKESETDFRHNVTTYSYDDANRIASKTEPEGRSTAFTYDELGHVLSETVSGEGVTHVTRYEYKHPLYFKTKTIRENGPGSAIETRALDDNGNATTITDANGHATNQSFDAFDRVTSIDAPKGRSTTITYDGVGNKLTETIGARTRSWKYDDANRMIKATDGTGAAIVTDYYPNGAPKSKTDARGNATGYTIDRRNNVTAITGPLGEVTHRDYSGTGKVVSETLPSGNTITNAYDIMDRLSQSTDSVGKVSGFDYDADGHPTIQQDGRGANSTFSYDGLGRKKTADLPEHRHREWSYDVHGNVLTEKDGRGNVTRHDYDALSRRTRTTLPGGFGERSWTYDPVGNVLSSTDSNHFATLFGYDEANRKITQSIDAGDGGKEETFGYNVLDQMVSHSDRRGIVETMTYDLEGRQKSLTRSGIVKFTRTFDPNGNLDTDTDAANNTTQYKYDVSNHRVSADHAGEKETWEYSTLTSFATAYTDGAGHRTTMVPDARERLEQETNPQGETTKYQYDLNNNRLSVEMPVSTTGFDYDGANRLTALHAPGDHTNTYTYTPDDQLETITNANNFKTTLGIDALGRVTSRVYPGGSTFSMTYDGEGNLKTEERGNGVSVNRTYNGMNRETLASFGGAGSSVVLVHRYDGNGNVEAVTEQSGGNSVVVTRKYNDQNWLMSEEVSSDNNPTPLATTKYFAGMAEIGAKSLAQGSLSKEDQQVIGFTGYQKEEAVGLYYAGARFYDPLLGEFNSLDPAHGDPKAAMSFNPYIYALGNPLYYIDPTGKLGVPGHYYSTLLATSRLGYSEQEAQELSFYSQIPDQATPLDAVQVEKSAFFSFPALFLDAKLNTNRNFVQTVPHALVSSIGRPVPGVVETGRTVEAIRNAGNDTPAVGILIHRLGDTYFHRDENGMLATTGLGHGLEGTAPDAIQRREALYKEYMVTLVQVLGERKGIPQAELDKLSQQIAGDAVVATSQFAKPVEKHGFLGTFMFGNAEDTELDKAATFGLRHSIEMYSIKHFSKNGYFIDLRYHPEDTVIKLWKLPHDSEKTVERELAKYQREREGAPGVNISPRDVFSAVGRASDYYVGTLGDCHDQFCGYQTSKVVESQSEIDNELAIKLPTWAPKVEPPPNPDPNHIGGYD